MRVKHTKAPQNSKAKHRNFMKALEGISIRYFGDVFSLPMMESHHC